MKINDYKNLENLVDLFSYTRIIRIKVWFLSTPILKWVKLITRRSNHGTVIFFALQSYPLMVGGLHEIRFAGRNSDVGDNLDYILTGGRIFYKTGDIKRDIWIRSGKIYKIHDDLKAKSFVKRLDIQGYGVFPGFIYPYPLWPYLRLGGRYLNQMRRMINQGYTSFIDVIQWNPNHSISDLVAYHSALHVNSPLDYAFRLYIPMKFFNAKVLRGIGESRIRYIILGIEEARELQKVDWGYLNSLSQYYGLAFSIYPHNSSLNNKKRKKQVEEIRNYWYYLNHRYNVRFMETFDFFMTSDTIPESPIKGIQIMSELSSQTSKMVGIYPRKGCIAVGSDADLVIISLESMKQNLFTPHLLFINGNLFMLPVDDIPIGKGNQLETTASFTYRF